MEPVSSFIQNLANIVKPFCSFFLSRNWVDSGYTYWREYSIIAAIFSALAFSWLLLQSKKKKSLKLPPGPRGVPLLGNLPFLDPELHSYFADLARVYGPIMKLRLGNKLAIILSTPDMAREVLKDQDVTFANRDVPTVALTATYGGLDIAWTPYGPEWRMLRKVCALKMLSNPTLDSVYKLRRKEIRDTVGYFYNRAGSLVNVGEQTFLTILNVITSMMWGGTVRGKERATIGAEFRQLVSDMIELVGKPNISDFYPGLSWFDLQGMTKKMTVIAGRFDKIFEMMINQRRKIEKEAGEDDKQNNDFLQFLLKFMEEADSKVPFKITHLKALLMDMVVGGTDTSSNTIEFAMAEIMNNPEVMNKVQEELDTVIGKDTIVEESDIHKLPYLQATMKESLRLHPSLPLLLPHSPSVTCTVGGYEIPAGSRVFVNVWAIQRDPLKWEKPLEFNPERFLNSEWDYSGKDFHYFPFGSGRRICAGVAMGERTVMHSLATLLHSFDWKLPPGEKMDVTEKFGIVLKKKTPLVAIPTPRLSDPALYQ